MPDERLDSMRQGIQAPPESPSASAAARDREKKLAGEQPIDGAMGGTSDSESAGDEADMDAKVHASENTPEAGD